jgi:hypothetical protein
MLWIGRVAIVRSNKVGWSKLCPQKEIYIKGVHFLMGCDSLV